MPKARTSRSNPGGGRTYTAELDILLQMRGQKGISNTLKSIGGLMDKVVFSTDLFSDRSKTLEGQLKNLVKTGNKHADMLNRVNVMHQHISKTRSLIEAGQIDFVDLPIDSLLEYKQTYEELGAAIYKIGELRNRTGENKLTEEQLRAIGATEQELEQLKKYKDSLEPYIEQLDDVVVHKERMEAISERVSVGFEKLNEIWTSLIGNSTETKEFFDIITSGLKTVSPLLDIFKQKMTGFLAKKLFSTEDTKTAESGSGIFSKLAGMGRSIREKWTGVSGIFRSVWTRLKGVGSQVRALVPSLFSFGAGGTAAGAGGTAVATGTTAAAGGTAALTAALGPLIIIVGSAIMALGTLAAGFAALKSGITRNIEVMEEFRLAYNRATGSIRELTDTTYDLTMSLGVSNKEALTTVKALTEVGFAANTLGETVQTANGEILRGQDALKALAEQNAMFTKTTGASSESAARLQKRMVVMNMTVEAQESLLGQLTLASRTYGLTGQELTNIVDQLQKQSMLLDKTWSDTDFNEYAAGYIAMASAAKELGLNLDVANQIMQDIVEGKDAALALAAIGGNIEAYFNKDAADNLDAVAGGAKRVLEMAKNMSGIIRLRFLEEFGGEERIQTIIKAQERRANMTKEEIKREEELAKIREKTAAMYNESLQTITQSLQRITAPILAVIAEAVGPMIDELIKLFDYLRPKVMAAFEDFKPLVIPVFEQLVGLVKDVGSLFVDLIVPFLPALKFGFAMLMSMLQAVIVVIRTVIAVIKPGAELLSRLILEITQYFEPVVEFLKEGMKLLSESFDSISKWSQGIRSTLSDLMDLYGAWNLLYDAVSYVRNLIFGSSFLHIKEGVDEVSPALNFLKGLWNGLTAPIRIVKSAIETVFSSILNLPEMLLSSMNKIWAFAKNIAGKAADFIKNLPGMSLILNTISGDTDVDRGMVKPTPAQYEQTYVKSAETDIYMPKAPAIYTAQVSEARQATNEQLSNLVDGVTDMVSLLAMILDKEDPAARDTADQLKKLADKSREKDSHYPTLTSGFGERTNQWWVK